MTELALLKLLELLQSQYSDYLKRVTDNLRTAPAGTLQTNHKSGTSYYFKQSKVAKGEYEKTYLGKRDRANLSRLAQKKYDLKVSKEAQNNLNALEIFIGSFHFNSLEKEYAAAVSDDYDITPYHRSLADMISKWKNEEYPTNNYMAEHKMFETDNGEMVRSKSEVIIANALSHCADRLLYKYERPLHLKCFGESTALYPDFTTLRETLIKAFPVRNSQARSALRVRISAPPAGGC